MSNVHLPFVSVYQRMTDFVHTLAYASVIRNSVTGLLDFNSYNAKIMSIVRRNFEQYLTDNADIGKMFDSNFPGSFSNENS